MRCGTRGRLMLLGLLGLLLRPRFRLFCPGLMTPLKSRYDIIHDFCDGCGCIPSFRSPKRSALFSVGERYRRPEAQSPKALSLRGSTLDGKTTYSNIYFHRSLSIRLTACV